MEEGSGGTSISCISTVLNLSSRGRSIAFPKRRPFLRHSISKIFIERRWLLLVSWSFHIFKLPSVTLPLWDLTFSDKDTETFWRWNDVQKHRHIRLTPEHCVDDKPLVELGRRWLLMSVLYLVRSKRDFAQMNAGLFKQSKDTRIGFGVTKHDGEISSPG